jgi:hypothetical protein
MEEGSTSYRYTVDLSTTPWTVTIEKCAGYELIPTGKDAAGIETAVSGSRVSGTSLNIEVEERGQEFVLTVEGKVWSVYATRAEADAEKEYLTTNDKQKKADLLKARHAVIAGTGN